MEQTLEIIGTIIGIIYLWLEYRASIYLWIAGIIMPAIYLVVYYDAGLYADFGINVYYLLAAIYGWMMWQYGNSLKGHFKKRKYEKDASGIREYQKEKVELKHSERSEEGNNKETDFAKKKETQIINELEINGNSQKQSELLISRMPLRYLFPLILIFIGALIGIAWILIRFTDSTVPWLDSFTTAMSIIGMWMLARKYLEQWWAWIAVDAVSTGLYIYKGLDFTAGLYGLYTIIAIFGYFKWKKLMMIGNYDE